MTTLTKTPTHTAQTSGGNYRKFKDLNNLKNTNVHNYAISETPIGPKNNPPNRPSTVSVTQFQFNIPSNSVVKKITVHYRHSKRCGSPDNPNPFDCDKYNPNIPAPTIKILNTNLSAKGQAPPKSSGSHQTLTFNGLWEANVINSNDFGVQINYPSNTNTQYGFVLIGYLYLSIDYFVPNFSISASGVNPDKVYNHNEYRLLVEFSDSNLTGKTTNVNISVPSGLTLREWQGSGSVTRPQSNQLVWTPNLRQTVIVDFLPRSVERTAVVLTFDTDISFSGSTTSVTRDFTLSLQGSSTPLTHTATIYKELPEITEEGTGGQSFDYHTDSQTLPEIKLVTVDEVFEYTLQIDDDTWNEMLQTIYEYGIEKGWWTGTLDDNLNTILTESYFAIGNTPYNDLSLNQRLKWYDSDRDSWKSTTYYCALIDALPDKNDMVTLKGISVGYDELYMYLYGGDSSHTSSFGKFLTWKLLIRPQESSLSVPYLSFLEPSEEEQDRLGDGYNYIVQSDMKLNTSETYTRDWYKNFRIGVFNNRIKSNCSEYLEQSTTDVETLTTEFRLPYRFDLTDGYLQIKASGIGLTMIVNDITYYEVDRLIGTEVPLFDEYVFPVIFKRRYSVDHWEIGENVNITVKQYTSDNTLVNTVEYHIHFNADEEIELHEVEVDTTNYDNLTDTEIFSNAEYWTSETAGLNTSNSVETEFTYDENYPLYIIITGDYPEGDPSNNTIEFTEPCIIEKDQYTKRLTNGLYPEPIESTISEDDTSELTLPSFGVSETIVFYDLPLEDNYGTDTTQAVRGIELRGNIEQSDRLILYAKLKSPTGESRQRSIVINDYDTNVDSSNSFSIGGNGDIWGFNTLDIHNLENWEAELTISNNLEETTGNINFGEIQLVFYIETVEQQPYTCYIEGEDIRYYGAFITDVKIPEGLETDTNYLKVDGTDTNDAYRQNITSKTIEIEFELGNDCDLEANTLSRRELAKLLVNDRDEYNRPIPKRIEFSHYPDVYWEYIMEETMEDKLDIGSYIDGKIKLTIPAGTSYDKETTTTSNTGYINGLATITPVILVKPAGETISILETITGQEFHIGYTGGWTDKILEIDCENRIAWLKTSEDDTDPVNLNKYVDFNSDWFRLKGEYQFTGVNCAVLTIDYQERW